MKKTPPHFLKPLFWDVDLLTLDVSKDSQYIIGKILEAGDEKANRWLKKKYTAKEIADVLFQFRFVSPKSANFWAIIYNLPREKILCLKKRSQKKPQGHWKY